MKHLERVNDYIGHMLQAIDDIASHIQSTPTQEAFSTNKLVIHAVICNFQIIGEAVGKIQQADPEFVSHHPGIAWVQIKNMRNKLIHDYAQILPEVIWDTINQDLPKLRIQLVELAKSCGTAS